MVIGCVPWKKRRFKKKTETDAVFENVWEMNALADADPETLRISMDTKATIYIGEYSRRGKSRGLEPVKAWDHDMRAKKKLVPGGILEPVNGRAFLFFTDSYKTSDFMADGLLLWWNERKGYLSDIKRLVINLDNGSECSGRRSQFLLRLTKFVDMTGLTVRLVCYPPYHSKYNAIERYWAGLEKSWNGYLPDTADTVLNRAANFVWKGFHATVKLLNTSYEKGVKVRGKEKAKLEERLQR
ncbi:MAG: ISAzo13 family transposase, partial [Delftia sp.]|nr:ISAzo13 family transposase [Delftia sp.]